MSKTMLLPEKLPGDIYRRIHPQQAGQVTAICAIIKEVEPEIIVIGRAAAEKERNLLRGPDGLMVMCRNKGDRA